MSRHGFTLMGNFAAETCVHVLTIPTLKDSKTGHVGRDISTFCQSACHCLPASLLWGLIEHPSSQSRCLITGSQLSRNLSVPPPNLQSKPRPGSLHAGQFWAACQSAPGHGNEVAHGSWPAAGMLIERRASEEKGEERIRAAAHNQWLIEPKCSQA